MPSDVDRDGAEVHHAGARSTERTESPAFHEVVGYTLLPDVDGGDVGGVDIPRVPSS